MIALIQKVKSAQVKIDHTIKSEISKGLIVYIGIHNKDKDDDVSYIIKKILNLRVFSNEKNKFNLSVSDLKLQLLIISNFTLNAITRTGNRPEFSNAMDPKDAKITYDKFINEISKYHNHISTGEFGSNMIVESVNDGPINIILFLDSSLTKLGFSDKKPYPGWTASTLALLQIWIIFDIFK